MIHSATLPFVLRRDHGVVRGHEVTSTREHLHGLLRLDGDRLVIQWRTAREISRVGREIRTDRELTPLCEVEIPISGLAHARTRRVWRRWRLVDVLVLNAADLRAFDALVGEEGVPGLVLEHPAELVLEVRRADRPLAREFASELELARSEYLLQSIELESMEEESLLPADEEATRADERLPGGSGSALRAPRRSADKGDM